ncbi:hypothetical protein O181_121944 [Austropuccinia psidii MF-1]|uniref:Uncharacterized protein n=1 Tax=Austropuccinia psidii MF-1 TaxID=1389203 RepID=A0A9Q3Q1V0_9BASI|nr:hypothetical protein [Austropuccinia psidii MF-1]
MAIHLLGSPYGISSHSSFMANWPYPSPVANMATSSSYGPFMAICVFGAFMALHLNPEPIAAIYAQMGISGHFPQNQGKWHKRLFLAIWAHNAHFAHLRTFSHFAHFCAFALFCALCAFAHICTFLRTLTQSVQKTLSRLLGQFLAQNPKVAKNPKGPRNTFPSSEAITSILFPSAFPSQDLWT